MEALLCGSPLLESPLADRDYTLTVHDLAETSAFNYLLGGADCIYGVNLPSTRVLVALDPCNCSFDRLTQAVGRAGRTGKSTRAEILFANRHLASAAFSPALGGQRASLDERFAEEPTEEVA